jgi:hypothetical protein
MSNKPTAAKPDRKAYMREYAQVPRVQRVIISSVSLDSSVRLLGSATDHSRASIFVEHAGVVSRGLVWMPAARATSDAIAPGSSDAATIRSFSESGQRRRRCTDVITSTRPFVMRLSLGLVI